MVLCKDCNDGSCEGVIYQIDYEFIFSPRDPFVYYPQTYIYRFNWFGKVGSLKEDNFYLNFDSEGIRVVFFGGDTIAVWIPPYVEPFNFQYYSRAIQISRIVTEVFGNNPTPKEEYKILSTKPIGGDLTDIAAGLKCQCGGGDYAPITCASCLGGILCLDKSKFASLCSKL